MRTVGFIVGALMTGLVAWSSGILGPAAHPVTPGRPLVDRRSYDPANETHGDLDNRRSVASPAGSDLVPAARQESLLHAAGEAAPLGDAPSADPLANARIDEPGADTATTDNAPTEPDDEADAPINPADPVLPARPATDVTDSGEGVVNVADEGAGWLGFFTPFRSEASARGFAQHLEAATGRRFRVARAGPGDYRVEFRIVPEEDQDARIAEIEAASGLALRSGQL